ncbi:MAG TPA: DNA internalization-related competence protein ComEC/Rec2 [Pseudomonadales bacterium]
MRAWLVGLVLGHLVLAAPVAPLPLPVPTAWLMLAGILLGVVRRGLPACGFLVGFAWAAFAMQQLLESRLPGCLDGAEELMVVDVVSEPRRREDGAYTFSADVRSTRAGLCADVLGRRLRLTWYEAPGIGQGERWRVLARLRTPWAYQNPGGFDFERWLLAEGLNGSGYVVSGTRIGGPRASWRAPWLEGVRGYLETEHPAAAGVLYALVSGDGSLIASAGWRTLRDTGTVHLMVVSGLHVGLVAGMGYQIARLAVRALPLVLLWVPARRAGALGGVCAASGYVALTGGGVPGLRALCMSALVLGALAWGRRLSPWLVWLVALALVLVGQPAVVHRQGLWLSFGAVAVLIWFFAGRSVREPRLAGVAAALVRAQYALLLGLSPLLVMLQGQIPSSGPVANLVAVPVISFLVIPAALIGALLMELVPFLGEAALGMAAVVVAQLMGVLEASASLPPLVAAPRLLPVFVALATGLVMLACGGSGRHLLLCLAWAVWALPPDHGLPRGEFRVLAMDVGQGSAVLVDTKRHRLLFDAGPRYPSGFDLGAQVVLPTLVATGSPRLDALVISHADIDHSGGKGAVVGAVPVGEVYESRPDSESSRCSAGQSWRWDGVDFRFLHPPPLARARGLGSNDASCVLLIDNGRERALLPGDIGAAVEGQLLRALDPVDVLLAAHHGSASSSSRAFVRVLEPDVVFISAGRRNRYGHPHPDVVGRFAEVGARVHSTAEHGALVWDSRTPGSVRRWRRDTPRYWVQGSQAD